MHTQTRASTVSGSGSFAKLDAQERFSASFFPFQRHRANAIFCESWRGSCPLRLRCSRASSSSAFHSCCGALMITMQLLNFLVCNYFINIPLIISTKQNPNTVQSRHVYLPTAIRATKQLQKLQSKCKRFPG